MFSNKTKTKTILKSGIKDSSPTVQMMLNSSESNIKVEYEVIPLSACDKAFDQRKELIAQGLSEVEASWRVNETQIAQYDKEIDRLTKHADGVDYAIAVGCGILTGLIDAFWVGEFSMSSGREWGTDKVDKVVSSFARSQGCSSDSLQGQVTFLENKFVLPSDNLWSGKSAKINTWSHHLDDFAHHPTPVGLFFSILTQFTKKGYFQNWSGESFAFDVVDNSLIGNDIISKLFAGTFNWFGHLMSDASGSSGAIAASSTGMGIPGPLISTLKELSALPGINKTEFPHLVKKYFVGDRMDLRAELGVLQQLGRQALPVLLNEVLVRGFYFIRRTIIEFKKVGSFSEIDWQRVLPFKNRTIARMITIASGTFCAVDMADAGIRAAIKSGGELSAFATNFLLRVNFVGVGRFAVAVCTDVAMGIKRADYIDKRMHLYNAQIHLGNATVSYKQAEMWIEAESAEKAINSLIDQTTQASNYLYESFEETKCNLVKISNYIPDIEKHNPGLVTEILDIL